MKRIFTPLLLLAFCCCKAFAQQKLPDFGKIDIADLQMTECAFDKSADAAYLFKTSSITFKQSEDGLPQVITEFRARIKIFTAKGFANANINIPYYTYNKSVKITDVSAVVYNIQGNKVSATYVDRKQIFNDKSKSRAAVNSINFTFPGLQAGSVVEYRYTKTNKNGYNISPWLFQDEIPVLASTCIFNSQSQIETSFHINGLLPVEKDSGYQLVDNKPGITYTFTMHNVPAIKKEPFMHSLKDNIQRLDFAVTPQGSLLKFIRGQADIKWAVYKDYLLGSPYVGLQFNRRLDVAAHLLDSIKSFTEEEKINAVYRYVKNNVNWNTEQTFVAGDINEIVNSKTGNSAEMNILLLNLLRKANIVSYPLLVSTRSNGTPDYGFPSLGQFNGIDVLVLTDNRVYILDCVQKHQSYKMPPLNVLGQDALILDSRQGKWIKLEDNRILLKDSILLNTAVTSSGQVNGRAEILQIGFAKTQAIEDSKDDAPGDADIKQNNLLGEIGNDIKIDSLTTLHDADDNDTLVKVSQVRYQLANTGNIYFVNPFSTFAFKQKIFTADTRTTDVDFGCPSLYAITMSVETPDNFTVEELPKNSDVLMPDSSIQFKRQYTKEAGRLVAKLSLQFNKAVFARQQYAILKSFFDKIYPLINEQIILKKKDE